MSIYEDVIAKAYEKIGNDTLLKPLASDLGIKLLIESLAYGIENSENTLLLAMAETINPRSERALLYQLMNRKGYLKLQIPLKINFKARSEVGINYPKHTKLTAGANLFITTTKAVASANETITIEAMEAQLREYTYTLESTLYPKFKLNATYREIADIIVYKGDVLLERSQCFVTPTSSYMLETDSMGEMSVVFRESDDVKISDEVKIQLILGKVSTVKPNTISFIDYPKTIIEDIELVSISEPFMTTKEMRQTFLYNKNPTNSLVQNEDYKHLIENNVADLYELRIWHEKEENEQNGVDNKNINKIFVCYWADDNRDDEIERLILSHVKNRAVVFKSADIDDEVTVDITLTNYTGIGLSGTEIDSLKSLVSGKYRLLTKSKIHRIISDFLEREDIEIDIEINKEILTNERFYLLLEENIIVNVVNEDE